MGNETEIWKAISGYEGLYEVSNFGNVKSLPKKKVARGGSVYTTKEKIMSPNPNRWGYLRVNLINEGKIKSFKVHRLVMSAFIGVSDLHVDHIDTVHTNNSLSNLRYCTQAENQRFNREKLGIKYTNRNGTVRYHAKIQQNNKKYFLGSFRTENEARAAYNKARAELNQKEKTSVSALA
jgi:hypothetical protein